MWHKGVGVGGLGNSWHWVCALTPLLSYRRPEWKLVWFGEILDDVCFHGFWLQQDITGSSNGLRPSHIEYALRSINIFDVLKAIPTNNVQDPIWRCVGKPECIGTTNPVRSVLIMTIKWYFQFHPVNASNLHVKGAYVLEARAVSRAPPIVTSRGAP